MAHASIPGGPAERNAAHLKVIRISIIVRRNVYKPEISWKADKPSESSPYRVHQAESHLELEGSGSNLPQDVGGGEK
jgi:hypothetical protein